MIKVITWAEHRQIKPPDCFTVVTVSKATGWSRGLSPFFLGPCPLWGEHVSHNVENGWQHSKCYQDHLEDDDSVGDAWLSWASAGWNDKKAHRYPMGRGAKPLFSCWDGVRLNYIDARKAIYAPVYGEAVMNSPVFPVLRAKYERLSETGEDLYLVDFDAYDHHGLGMSLWDVVNEPTKTMGHAFVLAMLLEDPDCYWKVFHEGMALRESGSSEFASI